jgi:hypothetical protein
MRTNPQKVPTLVSHTVSNGSVQLRWTFGTRLAFRFTFCYFAVYALCSGIYTVWETIPWAGVPIENWLALPFLQAAQWISLHVFHLHGIGTAIGDSNSGDTILNWIVISIIFTLAVIVSVLWTAFDRRAEAYPLLLGWLRLLLRLTLAVAMLSYGLDKVFLSQMPPPSLAVLNEALGRTSPHMLLWTTFGLRPGFQATMGMIEVIAGLLVLYRRTALLGTLITIFITCNIVLYDYFFDVGVKIYAAHLLLMALVLAAPDLSSLFSYFWWHQPTPPRGAWIPRCTRRSLRTGILILEWAVLVMALGYRSYAEAKDRLSEADQIRNVTPFIGQWHVESAQLNGEPKPLLVLSQNATVSDLYIEPFGALNLRLSDGRLVDGDVHFDAVRHSVDLDLHVADHPIAYGLDRPDESHLLLTPQAGDNQTEATLMLVRVPLPAHYPLIDEGSHLVIERMVLR